MKTLKTVSVLLALAGLALAFDAPAEQPDKKNTATTMRVGTFDSRAVAIAYYRSEAFKKEMNALKKEYECAKTSGYQERVEELNKLGPAMQEDIRKQGFGTAPVDEILAKIEWELSGIAGYAGVDMILSKWDIAYQSPCLEFTDVTDLIVKLFEPDEQTREILAALPDVDPLPLEELGERNRK